MWDGLADSRRREFLPHTTLWLVTCTGESVVCTSQPTEIQARTLHSSPGSNITEQRSNSQVLKGNYLGDIALRSWGLTCKVWIVKLWGVRCEVILIEGSWFHNKQVRREILTAMTDLRHQWQLERGGHLIITNHSYVLFYSVFSFAITCYHWLSQFSSIFGVKLGPQIEWLYWVICNLIRSPPAYLSFRKVVTGPPRSEVVRSKNGELYIYFSV